MKKIIIIIIIIIISGLSLLYYQEYNKGYIIVEETQIKIVFPKNKIITSYGVRTYEFLKTSLVTAQGDYVATIGGGPCDKHEVIIPRGKGEIVNIDLFMRENKYISISVGKATGEFEFTLN